MNHLAQHSFVEGEFNDPSLWVENDYTNYGKREEITFSTCMGLSWTKNPILGKEIVR